jgi:hypothetical protein
VLTFFRTRESFWLQYQNGDIDAETWLSYRDPIREVMANDFARVVWTTRTAQGEFARSFVDEVEAFLVEFPPRRLSDADRVPRHVSGAVA